MKVLDEKLPIWISNLGKDRLDNNYYSPSYFEAKEKLKNLGYLPFGDMIEDVQTGLSPSKDGDVPVLEGGNVFPNVLFPSIEKYVKVNSDDDFLKKDDILVIKDGSPGVFAVCLDPLLERFSNKIAASQHLYVLRLKDDYKEFASFIVAFLNSKTGQSLVRRSITGAISPSVRDSEIRKIPILDPLPRKEIAEKIRKKVKNMQDMAIKTVSTVELSEKLFEALKVGDAISTSLPINWMPGGNRDAHGYYKD